MIGTLAASDHLPDYRVEFDGADDMVTFLNRGTMKAAALAVTAEPWSGHLDPDTYEDARNVAPGWDVHTSSGNGGDWLGENEIVAEATPSGIS